MDDPSGSTLTGDPEEANNPGNMNLECPKVLPDDDEWRNPSEGTESHS